MSVSVRDRSSHIPIVLPSAQDDFPFLRTRLSHLLYNIIPLPRTVEESEAISFSVELQEQLGHGLPLLKTFARIQRRFNQLETSLVLDPHRCIEFTPDGGEAVSDPSACEGYTVSNHLAPWGPLERTAWWKGRSPRIQAFTPEKNAALLINLNKGGRNATPEELELFAGSTSGVPTGLSRCPVCAEWKGRCLDPDPKWHGLLMPVACRCENDNLCARCFRPLYERKLNANYFNESDGHIWHVGGSLCDRHRCGRPPYPRPDVLRDVQDDIRGAS